MITFIFHDIKIIVAILIVIALRINAPELNAAPTEQKNSMHLLSLSIEERAE